jgi:hypothetical protein
MKNKYRFVHITDIFKLNEKEFNNLLKELPLMYDVFGDKENGTNADISSIVPYIDWTNDGVNRGSIHVRCNDVTLSTHTVSGDD